MRIKTIFKLGFLVTVLALPLWSAQMALGADEQRAPPTARTSGTLGPQVLNARYGLLWPKPQFET